MDPYSADIIWLVVVGFLIAFVLAFGIGANDVANSFGTSVGAGVLTIRQACWMATVCELAGAVLIGYKVSDTMRKGILDPTMYADSEVELMLGCLSALASSALWLLVATFFKLPISGTHSIVGSTIGFSLVARGVAGLQWRTLGTIVASWFVSPVLSGLMSTSLFWCIRRFILNAGNPLRAGLLALPIFYGATLCVNVFSIVHDGPKLLHMDNIPAWVALLISLLLGVVVAMLVQMFIVPWQRRKVLGQSKASGKPVKFTIDGDEPSPSASPKRSATKSRPASLVIVDASAAPKPLPAITETTELVAFRDQPNTATANGHADPTLMKNLMLDDLSTQLANTIHQHQANGTDNTVVASAAVAAAPRAPAAGYQFSPTMVERAERLLGKHSLDNTDLTVTSLNYIDEHQNTHNGTSPAATAVVNGRNAATVLQSYFERRSNPRSPDDAGTVAADNQSTSEADTLPVGDVPTTMAAVTVSGNGSNGRTATSAQRGATLSPNSSKVPLIGSRTDTSATMNALALIDEPEDVSTLFSFLQVLTASFGSFAHGGNDVSNAIGPLIAIWMIYVEGSVAQKSETPLWILVFGGCGISVGLWVWGRRVIETVGNDLTKITPSTGFTIEIGAAMTVLLASKIGLPVSTTHCKVGSVVFVGYTNAHRNTPEETAAGVPQVKAVDWALFRNIVYAWVVTVPVAALLSAGFMFVLRKMVL